jgi:hypothetical protein
VRQLIYFSTLVFILAIPNQLNAQSEKAADFSVTLTRVGCLGECPDYEVTVLGNGRVRYEGRAYVRVQGPRKRTIPIADVKKLAKKLQDEHFFEWEERDKVCVDFPEVHITVELGAQRKHVVEGCNSPGQVLALANQIDKITGADHWVR